MGIENGRHVATERPIIRTEPSRQGVQPMPKQEEQGQNKASPKFIPAYYDLVESSIHTSKSLKTHSTACATPSTVATRSSTLPTARTTTTSQHDKIVGACSSVSTTSIRPISAQRTRSSFIHNEPGSFADRKIQLASHNYGRPPSPAFRQPTSNPATSHNTRIYNSSSPACAPSSSHSTKHPGLPTHAPQTGGLYTHKHQNSLCPSEAGKHALSRSMACSAGTSPVPSHATGTHTPASTMLHTQHKQHTQRPSSSPRFRTSVQSPPPSMQSPVTSNLRQYSSPLLSTYPSKPTAAPANKQASFPTPPAAPASKPAPPSTQPTAKTCTCCLKPIASNCSLISASGRYWHLPCFTCEGCKQAVHGSNNTGLIIEEASNAVYHAACHQRLFHPKCAVCDAYIPAVSGISSGSNSGSGQGVIRFSEHPYWKEKYCTAHTSGPRCCACDRMKPLITTTSLWSPVGAGKELCSECVSTAVSDMQTAHRLFDEVLKFYQKMGMNISVKLPMRLVDSDTLARNSAQQGRDSASSGPSMHIMGVTVSTIAKLVRTTTTTRPGQAPVSQSSVQSTSCHVNDILIQQGMPELLTSCSMAHEVMHAYLRIRGVTEIDLAVEEGVCQLMAWLWLKSGAGALAGGQADASSPSLRGYLQFQIHEDRTATYGDGFRRAHAAHKKHGLTAVVETVVNTGRFLS